MNCLLRFLPLFVLIAFVSISCTTTTNTIVTNSIAPTITRFSPDTAWTFGELTIHGTNFGYTVSAVRVWIDTLLVQIESLDDTIMTVLVPEAARTGLIHVWAYEQTATSAKPVTIDYSFNPHAFVDSISVGGSFSIPGTGMNNYHGTLRISVNGVPFPIDSVFADRIVSHGVGNGYSGTVIITDSAGAYNPGSVLIVTRPSSWNTLSEIWNRVTVTESHTRTGYINGPGNTIDSTWQTTATYTGQHDLNIAGILFEKTTRGVDYSTPATIPNSSYTLFQINWDTVSQLATVSFYKYSVIPVSSFHTLDTLWYDQYQSLQTFVPVDDDIEFTMPSTQYQITEDSTDANGLVNWQETTSTTITSGSFDLILKH